MSMDGASKYYGKYRGTVSINIDPEQRGRLCVEVPDVTGKNVSTWALPCLPLAGAQTGIHCVPPVDSLVWVEYEQGDIGYPIWTGCWWGSAAEVPPLALQGLPSMPNILLQTNGQNSIVISDLPGGPGITIRSSNGAMITVNGSGIYLTSGAASISMTGGVVNINNGALTVQ